MLDIRPIKAKLREHYKALRREMPRDKKMLLDQRITRLITGLWQYKRCGLLLTYVSTALEVDTAELIRHALADNKRVAVPRCVDGTYLMKFYYIKSPDDLAPGSFGVPEPDPNRCRPVTDFSNSLCLVPALCYDWKGYRLGYGKGYYDRFLADYTGIMVGAAYSSCIRRRLPHGKFDRPVGLLVTESYIRRTDHPAQFQSEQLNRDRQKAKG